MLTFEFVVEAAEKMLRQVERERESAAHVWFHLGMHGFIQEFVHLGDTVYQKSSNNRSEALILFERTAARSSTLVAILWQLSTHHVSRFRDFMIYSPVPSRVRFTGPVCMVLYITSASIQQTLEGF